MAKTVQQLREERAAALSAVRNNKLLNYSSQPAVSPSAEGEGAKATSPVSDLVRKVGGALLSTSTNPVVRNIGTIIGMGNALDAISPKVGDTSSHIFDSVREGVYKTAEGAIDFVVAQHPVVTISELFGGNVAQNAKEFVERDHVGEWFDKDIYKERRAQSYMSEGGFGEGIAQGVGGMLPSVALAIATGGGSVAAQTASLLTTGISAAGNSTEQALNDGANLGQARAYGTVMGGLEMATEKLVGGGLDKVFGGGWFDNVLPSVGQWAKTGGGRYAANAVGEGLEEVGAELADPLAKTIYKGKDALEEYKDLEYWKGVGKAGLSGAAISGIYGGAFDAMGGGVKAGDIRSVLEDIESIKTQAQNRKVNGKLTAERAKKADSQTLGDLRLIEKTLKSVDENKRAELIKNNNLSGLFDADGSLNADYAEVLSKDSIFDRRYYSENQRGREKNIDEDIRWVNIDLKARRDNLTDELYNSDVKYSFVGTKKDGTREYKSDFDESVPREERVKLFKSRIASVFNLGMVELKTDTKKLQIRGDKFTAQKNLYGDDEALQSEHNAKIDALYDMADILQTAKYMPNKTTMEPSYQNPAIAPKNAAHKDVKYWYKFQNDIIFDGVPFTVTFNIRDKGKEQYQYFIDFKDKNAGRLNQPYSLKRPPTSIDNRPTLNSIAQNSEMSIENQENIDENLWNDNVWEVGVFDGELSEKAQARYSKAQKVVNVLNKLSGKEIGLVVIKDNSKINGFLSSDGRRIYISADNFESGKWAGTLVHEYTHFEEGTKEYNELVELLESDADLSERMSKVVLNKKAYGFDAEAIKKIRSKIANGEDVSREERWAYEVYRSELEAHMSEAVLGTESFIDRVIRTDAPLAEKIIGKITDLKEAFGRIGDPEAQAQHKRLVEAERLYLKAAEAAGKKYENGKLVALDEEEEEKENTAVGGGKFDLKDAEVPTYEELVKKEPIRVIDISVPQTEGTFKERRKKIIENAEHIIKKPYLNKDTNTLIFLSNSSYTHTFSNSGEYNINVAEHLPEIIENAIFTHKENATHGNSHVNNVYTFFTCVGDGDLVCPVKLKVKEHIYSGQELPRNIQEYFENSPEDYYATYDAKVLEVEQIEESPLGSANKAHQDVYFLDPNGLPMISIADLLELVKGDAQKYIPQKNSNKVGQFSFKEDSDNSKEYKQYTQKEIKALVSEMLSNELVFEKGRATFEKKADIEQEVKKRLDTASVEKSTEKAIEKIADYILKSAHIKGVYAEPEADIVRHQKTLEAFAKYKHSLDLTTVMAELQKRYGEHPSAFFRWNQKNNNPIISLEQLKSELAEKGFKVDGKTPEQVFFMMDNAYQKANKIMKAWEKNHGSLKEALSEEEYSKAREGLIKRISEAHASGGKASEAMRVVGEREKKLSEREQRVTEKEREAMQNIEKAAKETLYSKEEAKAVVDRILDEVLHFGGQLHGVLRNGTYTSSINKAFATLNSTEAGKRWAAANELAGFIMKRVSLVDTIDPVSAKPYIETIGQLKPFLRGVDLSGIKDELEGLTGSDSVFRRWHKPSSKGGISISAFFEELTKQGRTLDTDKARAIMLLDEEYLGCKEAISEKVELELSDMVVGEQFDKLKADIAKSIMNGFDDNKDFSYANLKKIASSFAGRLEAVSEQNAKNRREKLFFEGEYEKYYKKWQEQKDYIAATKGLSDATKKTLEAVKDIQNWKKGVFETAAQKRNSNFKDTIGSFARLNSNGLLNRSGGRKIFQDALKWYTAENELFYGYFNKDIADNIKEIANGTGMYTTAEVQKMGDVVRFFKRVVEEYNKVFKKGKLVDAFPLAQGYQQGIKEDMTLKTTVTYHNAAFFKEIIEPMALARAADRYRADGFFTETMEELRQGLIETEWLKYTFRKDVDDFLKKQGRKYQKSLSEDEIKVGDIMIPKNNALLLYMTTKDSDAEGALNIGGFSIVDKNKKPIYNKESKKALTVDGLIYERIEAGEEVTLEEAMSAVANLRSELYDQFSDADKELIRIAENFFNKIGRDVKKATDEKKKGFSNVKEGYYVTLSHEAKADEVGIQEEHNGTLSYKFNESRVKGAKGRLVIAPLTDVLFGQMSDIATYAGLTTPIENFNRLYNLNTSDSYYKAVTIKSLVKSDGRMWSDGIGQFQKIIDKIEGGGENLGAITKGLSFLRGGLVRTWLSLNPKVMATQFSSLAASFAVLDPKYTMQGIPGKLGKEGQAELDKYCRLAALRNADNSAALAQGVIDRIDRFGDFGMKGIGMVDRFVITRLWQACRLQVQGEQKLKLNSEENKIAAGKLLEKVILETQQNSIVTERSALMRSDNEIFKSFTMFTSDAMKQAARFLDGYGHWSTVRRRIKLAKDSDASSDVIEKYNQELKEAKKQLASATAGMLTSAVYMAVISLLFKALYGKTDDEEDIKDIAFGVTVDVVGNLLGGFPIIKDIWGFITDGYEIKDSSITAVNNVLNCAKGVWSLSQDIISGKQVETSDIGSKIKNMLYGVGQIFGVPLGNVHNVLYGTTRMIDKSAAYKWDSLVKSKSYSNDLAKAIEAGDDKLVARIASLMVGESFDGVSESVAKELRELVATGANVLPRTVGDSITYDGEEYAFTLRQRKRFEDIYGTADEVLADLVKLKQYKSADDAVKARAVKFIYDTYYDLAVDDMLGVDSADKNVLFAEAIDIEKLAIIVAQARLITADKDKNGNSISGTKKLKIAKYIESLSLTAVQKHMIYGYLGYSNSKGEEKVRAYINRLKLTSTEKKALMRYSGYDVA